MTEWYAVKLVARSLIEERQREAAMERLVALSRRANRGEGDEDCGTDNEFGQGRAHHRRFPWPWAGSGAPLRAPGNAPHHHGA